jgi:hypothetical protein
MAKAKPGGWASAAKTSQGMMGSGRLGDGVKDASG